MHAFLIAADLANFTNVIIPHLREPQQSFSELRLDILDFRLLKIADRHIRFLDDFLAIFLERHAVEIDNGEIVREMGQHKLNVIVDM